MRITQHNGRTGAGGKTLGTAHNDRNFDIRKADNIQNSGEQNFYMARGPAGWVTDGSISFDDAERQFYQRVLSEDLKQQNDRAIRARHKERIQDIDQYRKSRKHCPEERIIQIGSKDGSVPPDVFRKCMEQYVVELDRASNHYFKILNVAIHNDEAVPHAHIRGVWIYRDQDGIIRTGQEKALEQAGFSPECKRPGREEDPRYCNRKIAFDSLMREKWLDICQAHGLQIEREPLPDGHHNRSKEDMIRDKYADALEIIAKAERIQQLMEKDINSKVFAMYADQVQRERRDALRDLSEELEDRGRHHGWSR